jgi:hypothetical protein
MFKKIRDKVTEATQQATERATGDFARHAQEFRKNALATGHDITPQLPTSELAGQAYRSMAADPEMAAFLALPAQEQLRQQEEVNAYGAELRRLYDTCEHATAVVRLLEPTGRSIAGQPQYTATLDVTRADGSTYRTMIPLLVPVSVFAQYAPGTRHDARVDAGDPGKVAVFGLLD